MRTLGNPMSRCPMPQFTRGRFCLYWMVVLISTATGHSTVAQGVSPVTAGRLRVEVDRVVDQAPSTSLFIPIYMDTANDDSGRLFFGEQSVHPSAGVGTRLRVFDNGSFSTFLDLSDEANLNGPRGLLGFTFHPEYANPSAAGYRKLYTFHTVETDESATVDFSSETGAVTHHNVVTEWQVDENDPNSVDLSSRREIIRQAHVGQIHSGGMLEFGPDGYLYGAIGSGPGNSTIHEYAQDNSDMMGTIFRIDPVDPDLTSSSNDTISANGKYRIPEDNPFVDSPDAHGEIFASGLRNPFRFSIDPESELLFAGDVGQGAREEVNVINAGDNLGWPYFEGEVTGIVPPPDPPPAAKGPLAMYDHGDGRSVIGGYVYRGSIPELQGKYIFGEFSWGSGPFFNHNGRLFYIDPFDESGDLKDPSEVEIQELLTGTESCSETLNSSGGCHFDSTLMSFGIDDDGELYAVSRKSGRASVYKFTDAYSIPEGDYNEDGVVDAADYTVWRDSLGQSVRAGSEADGNGNGIVDAGDYEVWKAHFGEIIAGAGGGALANGSVPEPSAVLLAIGGIVAATLGRCRRPQSCVATAK